VKSALSGDVLLINPHYVRRHGGGIIPPIGLCYLAAALQSDGATVRIVDLAATYPEYDPADDGPLKSLARKLKRSSCTMIGIGPLVTATLQSVADISSVCREHTEAQIVVGGPLCAVPGAAGTLSGFIDCDWVVAGDGETPIVELWRGRRTASSTPPGGEDPLLWREPNLNDLPVPARELLGGNDYSPSLRRGANGGHMTSAFLSRGCPYSCSFCAAPLSSGKLVRRFSMARIGEELNACAALRYQDIVFYDDCLFVRSPRLDAKVQEFIDAIDRSSWRGSYQLELRCDAVTAMSEQVLSALASSGCRQINMGIEKGHVAALAAIRKRLTPEIAQNATERLVQAGIRAAGTFILGGPGETREDIDLTVAFATSLDLDFAHFNPLALYPGTTMFDEIYPGANWLELCLDQALAPFGDILWRSPALPLPAILDGVQVAYTDFYSDARLARVVARLPESERSAVSDAYVRLRTERGHSWDARPGHQREIAR
jgi:anaerobic magnesium-protoporphyrin IX monomethyl ester cyclase